MQPAYPPPLASRKLLLPGTATCILFTCLTPFACSCAPQILRDTDVDGNGVIDYEVTQCWHAPAAVMAMTTEPGPLLWRWGLHLSCGPATKLVWLCHLNELRPAATMCGDPG